MFWKKKPSSLKLKTTINDFYFKDFCVQYILRRKKDPAITPLEFYRVWRRAFLKNIKATRKKYGRLSILAYVGSLRYFRDVFK